MSQKETSIYKIETESWNENVAHFNIVKLWNV